MQGTLRQLTLLDSKQHTKLKLDIKEMPKDKEQITSPKSLASPSFSSPIKRRTSISISYTPDALNKTIEDITLPPKAQENMQNVLMTADAFDDTIGNLDNRLNRVLKKHEYEYLQAYNFYVKAKEAELTRAIH